MYNEYIKYICNIHKCLPKNAKKNKIPKKHFIREYTTLLTLKICHIKSIFKKTVFNVFFGFRKLLHCYLTKIINYYR